MMKSVILFILVAIQASAQNFAPSYLGSYAKVKSNAPVINHDHYFNGAQLRAFEESGNTSYGVYLNFMTYDKKQMIDSYGGGVDFKYGIGKHRVQPFVGLGVGVQKYKFYGDYFSPIKTTILGHYVGCITNVSLIPSVGVSYLLFQDEISEFEIFCQISKGVNLHKFARDELKETFVSNQLFFNFGFIFRSVL